MLSRWRLCTLHVCHAPLLNCCRGEKRKGSSVNCSAIRSRAATLWAKAFAIALHPDDVTNDFAQRRGIQREGRRIYRGYGTRRFNPLANGGDVVCGLLWAILRKRTLNSEHQKISINVRRYPRCRFPFPVPSENAIRCPRICNRME